MDRVCHGRGLARCPRWRRIVVIIQIHEIHKSIWVIEFLSRHAEPPRSLSRGEGACDYITGHFEGYTLMCFLFCNGAESRFAKYRIEQRRDVPISGAHETSQSNEWLGLDT